MARHRLPHTRKARCHPTRWALRFDLCADCAPLLPGVEPEARPTPVTCPHCRAKPPIWHCDAFGGRCVACGQLWHRALVAVRL